MGLQFEPQRTGPGLSWYYILSLGVRVWPKTVNNYTFMKIVSHDNMYQVLFTEIFPFHQFNTPLPTPQKFVLVMCSVSLFDLFQWHICL